MSFTAQKYVDAVVAHGYDVTTQATPILAAVNLSRQDLLNERRWGFLQTLGNAALTTTANQEATSTAGIADLLYLDAVRMQDTASTGYELEPVSDLQEFRRLANLDRTASVPIYWMARPGATPPNIYLGPRPNAVFTLLVDYVQTAADLATVGATEAVIPQNFIPAVAWKAVAHMAFRGRDQAGMSLANQSYAIEVAKLASQEEMGQRQRADSVVSSGYWDAYDAEVIF